MSKENKTMYEIEMTYSGARDTVTCETSEQLKVVLPILVNMNYRRLIIREIKDE